MSGPSEILFLCSRLPFPPNKGDKIRSHALLAHLVRRHVVHLACFAESEEDRRESEKVREVVNGEALVLPISLLARYRRMAVAIVRGTPMTAALFSCRELDDWVKSLCERRRIAATVLFGSAMAPTALARREIAPATVLFDMVDIDSDKWSQLAARTRQPRRWIYRRESRLLLALERNSAAQFGATLLVSPFESASFARMAPESATRIRPLLNGVDSSYFAPGSFQNPYPPSRTVVVMTGHMDYEPNAEAACWFADKVLPRVRARIPDLCFYAVGARPTRALLKRVGEDVKVTGYVDDVRPFLQYAHAVVAPLRIARGLQNKVLEAMAMQKTVVATWEATRALSARPGEDLLVARDAEDFATSVVDAVSGKYGTMGTNARNYVRAHHDWNLILGEIDDILSSISRGSTDREQDSSSAAPDSFHLARASG